jgi:hypothetical protein
LLIEISNNVNRVLDGFDDHVVDHVMKKTENILPLCFFDVAAADYVLNSDEVVIDRYIALKGKSIRSMAMEFLVAWKSSSVSLYEVQKVDLMKSVTVTDLFSRKTFTVSDNKIPVASRKKWDTFFARFVQVGEEFLALPALLEVNPLKAVSILDSFREIRENTHGSRTLSWQKFFKKHWHLIPMYWLEGLLVKAKGPTVSNTDGEPVHLLLVKFSLRPGSELIVPNVMRSIPGLVEDSESDFRWVVDKSSCDNTSLDSITAASLTLSENLLVAQVNSPGRADRIEALLSQYLGNHILKTVRDEPDLSSIEPGVRKEIPLEIRQELVSQFLNQHYRKWLDMPNQLLSGKTPRKSVSVPSQRKKLAILLRDFEASPPMDGVVYDYSWLRRELGLESE